MALKTDVRQYGSLTCRVVDALDGRPVRRLVVLGHGYGAPGTDLVDLAGWFLDGDETIAASVRFAFPAAPLDLTSVGLPGGRAWWPISMAMLADVNEAASFEALTTLQPAGLQAASDQLVECIRALQRESGIADDALFLGGFSQGAMASTDVVLRNCMQPAGLILMSGALICRDDWTRLAEAHPGCLVIQTHGLMDPVLPYTPATWLRDLLRKSGFDVRFESFVGPHTIPPEALTGVQNALVESLSVSTGKPGP